MILDRPFLEVGVGDGHKVDKDGSWVIALFQEVRDGRFGILAFGELSLVAVIKLHDRRDMGVTRGLPA